MGGAGEDPAPRWRPSDRQSRRRHPLRRTGHHARHRGGVGSARLRTGRLLLPNHPRGRDTVVPHRRGSGPSGQRLPSPPRSTATGPGVPGGDQGHLQDLQRPLPAATVRTGRLRGDRHESRRSGGPHRRGGRRGVHAHRLPHQHPGPGPQSPLFSGHRQRAADGPRRLLHLLPGQDQATRPRSRSPSTWSRASSGIRGAG